MQTRARHGLARPGDISPSNKETHSMDIEAGRQKAIDTLIIASLFAGIVAVGLSNVLSADPAPIPKADEFSPYVTTDGGISLPLDYREKFVHLGTYAVATKPGKPVDEMHNVYTRPEDVEAYRRDGKFPDGAILVKDVTTVGSEKLTTGQSSWTKDIKIWFVMVKDSKRRFPKNDLWGDGWGWALFEAKNPKKNVATDYTSDCRVCHIPAKKDDWVYVRGYPVLGKAELGKSTK
jgi:cytochrome c